MRRGATWFAVAFVAGLVLLLALGALQRRDDAFTLGVTPSSGAALPPGGEICQGPIDVPSDFERVRVQLGAARALVVPVDVTVRDWRSRERIAAGPGLGHRGAAVPTSVAVGSVPAGRRIAVCVRNDGDRKVSVYGTPAADPASYASYRGQRFLWDMSVVFQRANGASPLALTGDMAERAALFRGGWIGAWTVWLVVALLLTAFPLLLARALRGAEG